MSIKHKWLIRGGVVIVGVGMAVSAPAALSQDWLAVLSYLSITAAGLMMVITGVSQRNAAEGRANHAEVMEQMAAQKEETARLRPLLDLVHRHQLQLAEQAARLAEHGKMLTDQDARITELVRRVSDAERVANEARDLAAHASLTVPDIGVLAGQIADVVERQAAVEKAVAEVAEKTDVAYTTGFADGVGATQ